MVLHCQVQLTHGDTVTELAVDLPVHAGVLANLEPISELDLQASGRNPMHCSGAAFAEAIRALAGPMPVVRPSPVYRLLAHLCEEASAVNLNPRVLWWTST